MQLDVLLYLFGASKDCYLRLFNTAPWRPLFAIGFMHEKKTFSQAVLENPSSVKIRAKTYFATVFDNHNRAKDREKQRGQRSVTL